tara:strand:- start:444 stop:1472 length:1029 start_codon:yes stop_codon:yes gene_type:complete
MNIKQVTLDKEKKVCVHSYIKNGRVIDLDSIKTSTHLFYQRMYWNRPDIFDIIPNCKHREYINSLDKSLDSFELSEYDINIAQTYENLILPLFNKIEENGLYTKNGYEHSKYNLFTITGRPSNANNGINYAALNKADGSRERFTSRFSNGFLLEMDFDAYHIRLIADLINYKLPDSSVHEYFAKQFYGVTSVTKEEYEQSKAMSFQVLYGGVPKELEAIEYFNKTKQYIFKLWDNYNYKGYIQTPVFNRRLYKNNLENMNPQKLFNYLIQAYETERNIKAIEKIHNILKGYNSKLILYTYDAFLFDCAKEEISIIKNEIANNLDFPVKMHVGKNYNDMKLLT